jgi:magnesium transporter
MDLLWVDNSGVTERSLAELHDLRLRDDGFVWLDIPLWSADAERVLAEEFDFHPMAIAASRERNHTP